MTPREGWCLWITGLPGSGKSTIAQALFDKLKGRVIHAQVVSSDTLRKVVTPAPKYTEEERDMVYGAIVLVAGLLTRNGVNVIIDATGNRRKYRDQARREISRFMEAYVRCPLGVCIKREGKRGKTFYAPKGIYEKAFAGKSITVPGVGVPYEEPINPDVAVDSDKLDAGQCAERILEVLMETFISPN